MSVRSHQRYSKVFPVSGLASQVSNLLAIAPSAPTTAGITMIILTFHSCSSSMTDICQFFRAPCPVCSHLLALQCQLWGRSVIVYQHDVRPIVKQMLVSLDGKVPKDLGWLLLTNFSWFCPPVFTVLKIILSTYVPVYYWCHTVVSLSVLGPCEVAATTGDMFHGFCMLFAQPAFWILHSVVDLVCHCPGVEGLLLSSSSKEKKVLFYHTISEVILRLCALPESWESENTSEDGRRS